MESTIYEGLVQRWDPRGFGFIECSKINYKVFFHIRAFKRVTEPVLGERVTFQLGPATILGKPDMGIEVTPIKPVVAAGLVAVQAGA